MCQTNISIAEDESQENIPPLEEVNTEKRQKRAAPPPPVSPVHANHGEIKLLEGNVWKIDLVVNGESVCELCFLLVPNDIN